MGQYGQEAAANWSNDQIIYADADNLAVGPALSVGRSRCLRVVVVHNTQTKRRIHMIPADFGRLQEGFWVEDVSVPIQKNAADDYIADAVRAGDVVATDDIMLAIRCLRKGATVVSRTGARFDPCDVHQCATRAELAALARDRKRRAERLGAADVRGVDVASDLQRAFLSSEDALATVSAAVPRSVRGPVHIASVSAPCRQRSDVPVRAKAHHAPRSVSSTMSYRKTPSFKGVDVDAIGDRKAHKEYGESWAPARYDRACGYEELFGDDPDKPADVGFFDEDNLDPYDDTLCTLDYDYAYE